MLVETLPSSIVYSYDKNKSNTNLTLKFHITKKSYSSKITPYFVHCFNILQS